MLPDYIPANIKQLNIHGLTIIKTHSLSPGGKELEYYIPMFRINFIESGESKVSSKPYETAVLEDGRPPIITRNLTDIEIYTMSMVKKYLENGVIVTWYRGEYPKHITYDEMIPGRLFEAREILPLVLEAIAGITTFEKLWSVHGIEYIVDVLDEDDAINEYQWMTFTDDLLEFLQEPSVISHSTGERLQDIRPFHDCKPASPDNPTAHRRVKVDGYYVISCLNKEKNRKTYFSAFINPELKRGLRVHYSSTVKGAYHFLNEDDAVTFAMRYDYWPDGSFEVEYIESEEILCADDWMTVALRQDE